MGLGWCLFGAALGRSRTVRGTIAGIVLKKREVRKVKTRKKPPGCGHEVGMEFVFYIYSWGNDDVLHTHFAIAAHGLDHAIGKLKAAGVVPLRDNYIDKLDYEVIPDGIRFSVQQCNMRERGQYFETFVGQLVQVPEAVGRKLMETMAIPHIGNDYDSNYECRHIKQKGPGRPRKDPNKVWRYEPKGVFTKNGKRVGRPPKAREPDTEKSDQDKSIPKLR